MSMTNEPEALDSAGLEAAMEAYDNGALVRIANERRLRLAIRAYLASAPSVLAEALEVIRPFAEYERSDVFRTVYANAPENLYVMRNDNGHKVTMVTVGDFRAARSFLAKHGGKNV